MKRYAVSLILVLVFLIGMAVIVIMQLTRVGVAAVDALSKRTEISAQTKNNKEVRETPEAYLQQPLSLAVFLDSFNSRMAENQSSVRLERVASNGAMLKIDGQWNVDLSFLTGTSEVIGFGMAIPIEEGQEDLRNHVIDAMVLALNPTLTETEIAEIARELGRNTTEADRELQENQPEDEKNTNDTATLYAQKNGVEYKLQYKPQYKCYWFYGTIVSY